MSLAFLDRTSPRHVCRLQDANFRVSPSSTSDPLLAALLAVCELPHAMLARGCSYSTNNNITQLDKSHSRTFFAGLFLARPAGTLGDILPTPAGTVVISLGASLGACITN